MASEEFNEACGWNLRTVQDPGLVNISTWLRPVIKPSMSTAKRPQNHSRARSGIGLRTPIAPRPPEGHQLWCVTEADLLF